MGGRALSAGVRYSPLIHLKEHIDMVSRVCCIIYNGLPSLSIPVAHNHAFRGSSAFDAFVRMICPAEDYRQAHDAAAQRQSRVKTIRQLGIVEADRLLHIEDVC